jgi:hypothetical protein
MAFNRTTRCSGQIVLTGDINVNVDFEYNEVNNTPPSTANFNFQLFSTTEEPKTNIWVNGSFDVDNGVIRNYNVSSGVVSDGIMNELITELAKIKTNYKTI